MGVKQKTKSLKRTNHALSDTFVQLQVLNGHEMVDHKFEDFKTKVGYAVKPNPVEIFQLNIGKLCNQTCAHCHVDAGPDRKVENMDRATLERCLEIITTHNIPTVDITGGAPEMNPHFRWFVESCTAAGARVMDRCNLTILKAHPIYSDLPEFFQRNHMRSLAHLAGQRQYANLVPCGNTRSQLSLHSLCQPWPMSPRPLAEPSSAIAPTNRAPGSNSVSFVVCM